MNSDVVIVGAGIAGLTCALELDRAGIDSILVEKAPFPGGKVARFSCKAVDSCRRCGACVLEDLLEQVGASERIAEYVRTEVHQIEATDGRYRMSLERRPARIHRDKCTDCGQCEEACPAPGALVRSPVDGGLSLDEEICLFYRDGSCRACLEACSDNAVSLDQANESWTVNAGSVILSSGYRPFDPDEKPRFGHRRIPGVVTALELDALLRDDNWQPKAEPNCTNKVAFIQCVGSRDVTIGRNYCSRVCCGYAMRMARLLRHKYPGIEPTMFYMDIQTYDRDFETRLQNAKKEVRLIRAMPADIRAEPEEGLVLTYQSSEETRITEAFDLVVLSIGISPNATLADLFGINRNMDGFMGDDVEAVTTSSAGIFVAGTAQGPRSIADTMAHATKTALAAARYVEHGGRGATS